MYMLILNFTYPLRCLRVPPVEYHWITHVGHWQDRNPVPSLLPFIVSPGFKNSVDFRSIIVEEERNRIVSAINKHQC